MNHSLSSSFFNKKLKNYKTLLYKDVLFKYILTSSCGIAFQVSRKYGNSVQRNLFKRRCRMLFKTIFINKKKPISLVVMPKTKDVGYKSLKSSFIFFYEKISN